MQIILLGEKNNDLVSMNNRKRYFHQNNLSDINVITNHIHINADYIQLWDILSI